MTGGILVIDRCRDLMFSALRDPGNRWSMGTFGAIGEFIRDADELHRMHENEDGYEVVTARGAIRLKGCPGLQVFAYETLGQRSGTWGNEVSFCVPAVDSARSSAIRCLGADTEALRSEDQSTRLFDLGVGIGHVGMRVRSQNAELTRALQALEGKSLFSGEAATARMLILRESPARILTSPAGRIEVYSRIPGANEPSPNGPHTHLLPRLLAGGRTHSANTPIPPGFQPVLALYPPSPWHDAEGNPKAYDQAAARAFDKLLRDHGLPDDLAVRTHARRLIHSGVRPDATAIPQTRRARAQFRITLRRLAQELSCVDQWRASVDGNARTLTHPATEKSAH